MIWARGQQLQTRRYVIQELIGVGRFGVTYRAETATGKRVVIKTLNDEALQRSDFDRLQAVFVKEAFKLSQCRHPHIVQVQEPFQEAGRWCIPMEYVAGMPLSKRDRNILPEAEALTYIRQIGEALQVVHSNGLLHRDVTPDNILLRIREGHSEAVLIDFGLARDFEHDLTQTRTEEITPGFAPLELYSRSADRGPYTDIYGLGATLYTLLTGKTPPSVIDRYDRKEGTELIFPKDLTQSIKRSIEWAMEIEAKKRPQSLQEWLSTLTASPSTLSSPTIPTHPQSEIQNPKSKINWHLLGALLLGAVTILGGLGALLSGWADGCSMVRLPLLCPPVAPSGTNSTPGTTP